MTDKEFQQLCKTTEAGTSLNFVYADQEVKVRFVACGIDEFVRPTAKILSGRASCAALKNRTTRPRPIPEL